MFFFFIIHLNFLFALKTEIKFQINNVPSLFRCQQNGGLYYFDNFPNHEEFEEVLTKTNNLCDLSLSSIDQRMIIEFDKLELLCENLNKKPYANEFLYFSSKCSQALCNKSLPLSATIITQYNRDRIDIVIHSTQLIIGKLTNEKYLVRRRIKNDFYRI